jgi:hypothetical protein
MQSVDNPTKEFEQGLLFAHDPVTTNGHKKLVKNIV